MMKYFVFLLLSIIIKPVLAFRSSKLILRLKHQSKIQISNILQNDLDSYKLKLKNEINTKFTTGGWFAIGPPSIFDTVLPFDIKVAGQNLVVWKNPIDSNTPTNGWSVMTDICPHRLAPLSKGRVDTNTGCIECPYHGWQFASNGTCTSIPQLESDLQSKLNLPSAASQSLPVYMTTDMLWAFVPLPTNDLPVTPHYYPDFPDEHFPELNLPSITCNMRDLPYSFDFLVENFMDVGKLCRVRKYSFVIFTIIFGSYTFLFYYHYLFVYLSI